MAIVNEHRTHRTRIAAMAIVNEHRTRIAAMAIAYPDGKRISWRER